MNFQGPAEDNISFLYPWAAIQETMEEPHWIVNSV